MPEQLADPIEPVNRGFWAFNHGLLKLVISPLGHGYRVVVPSPVRTSIRHFGYNIAYPGRVANQLLQGRLGDAREESARFACNTTVGVLGLFDVATKWDMPKHRGDFAQTFQKWGWDGDSYLMLPLIGPSDEVHAVGYGFDRFADPLKYDRETRMLDYGLTFNARSEGVDESLRRIEADPDAYSSIKYLWSYASKKGSPDWSVQGPLDIPTLQTLAVATLRLKDPDFVDLVREAKVKIPSTGKRLPFNYWLQKENAPLIYIAPGLGSHRLSMQALSVVENLYEKGFSVVSVSGLFHPEFIKLASTSKLPGYAPADRDDLLVALSEIDGYLSRKHGCQLGARALVGCSMGGFQALSIAADQRRRGPRGVKTACCEVGGTLRFDRFIAINPPVNLHYGLDRLDEFQNAPLAWPEDVRQQRINNAIHKVVAFMSMPTSEREAVRIDGNESKYLIGATFRITLRNAIFSSQRNRDMGLLTQPLSRWNREPVYEEIMGISYKKYFHDFVTPSYNHNGEDFATFKRHGNLKFAAPELANAPNAHVITSRNDFLLSESDIAWLEKTFGPERLTLLEQGGHLGALTKQGLHERLASLLEPLKSQ